MFLNTAYLWFLTTQLGFALFCFLSSEMTVISQKLTLAGFWRGQYVTIMVTQPEKPGPAQDCPLSEWLTAAKTFCISDVHFLVC